MADKLKLNSDFAVEHMDDAGLLKLAKLARRDIFGAQCSEQMPAASGFHPGPFDVFTSDWNADGAYSRKPFLRIETRKALVAHLACCLLKK